MRTSILYAIGIAMLSAMLAFATMKSANAADCGRIGPDSVNDLCLDVGLGILANHTAISNNDDAVGGTVMGSLFYLVPQPVNIGIEAMAMDWGQGLFLSGRVPVSDNINFIAGIGVLGYKVDDPIDDYYTHEPAITVGLVYPTELGQLSLRYTITSTDKNHYTNDTSQAPASPHCDHPHCDEDPVSTTTSSKVKTDTTYRSIGFGLNVPF